MFAASEDAESCAECSKCGGDTPLFKLPCTATSDRQCFATHPPPPPASAATTAAPPASSAGDDAGDDVGGARIGVDVATQHLMLSSSSVAGASVLVDGVDFHTMHNALLGLQRTVAG